MFSSSATLSETNITLYLSGLGQFGQAWYVNGDLAPDLYLVRGQKYTFIVEGGLGTDQEGIIHPFYLTSDNEGGYGTKSDYEARMEEIYGGLSRDRDGLPVPAVMGRLCLWRSPRAPPTFATYQDFKSSLAVTCQETGEPGVLRFSPDYDMPSVMYYQVGEISHSLTTLRSYTGTDHCLVASDIFHRVITTGIYDVTAATASFLITNLIAEFF